MSKKDIATIEAELSDVKKERDALKRIVASIDHKAVIKNLAKPRDDYSDEIPEQIIAMASVGMFGPEIRANLGISAEQWKDWGARIQAFQASASRARDLSQAYWHRIGREAVESKDWKMPFGNLMRMINEMSEDVIDDARGDASKLVIYSPSET